LTHFSRITSSAPIFFYAATPSLHLSLWGPKTCPTFVALASPISFPWNPTPLPHPPRLSPSRTPTTMPTQHPTLPSLPLSRQDHSILLTGLLLSALSNIPASHDIGISNACTTQISHSLQNQLLTSIGLCMGSTVGILYLRFGPSVFHSTLYFQLTLCQWTLSLHRILYHPISHSIWGICTPSPCAVFRHQINSLGLPHPFPQVSYNRANQSFLGNTGFGRHAATPYPITLHRHGLRAPRT